MVIEADYLRFKAFTAVIPDIESSTSGSIKPATPVTSLAKALK
jgi:hypothetical protein